MSPEGEADVEGPVTERLGDERDTRRRFGPTAHGPRPTGDETSALPDSEERTGRLDGSPRRRVLDRYVLERKLGAGGFGVVWLAFDEKLEREVAVKVIARDDGDPVSQRAEREARVAARLNHPGIVSLYELGQDDEAVYLVSELVPGRNLAELIRHGALSDRDVARIGVALCDALAHAHQRKVVHRDVKPQNVIVVSDPAAGEGFAKLADFGVAHLVGDDPLTRTGDIVGTLAYMAPEQAEGERVTGAADVYSLALTLYEAWAGTNPVRSNSPMGTARRLGTVLPPLRSRRRDLPEGLGSVVDEALDPDPERRPTVRALRGALQKADDELSEEGGLVEPGTLERLGLARSRRVAGAAANPGPRGMRYVARVAAGLAAGGLVLGAFEVAGDTPSASPLAIAGAAALIVAALPRLGWLLAATAIVAWLGAEGHEGLALLVAAGAAAIPLLLPRAGVLWSVPVIAPLLGVAGLGPLYLVVAGSARTAWRRAGLGAAGFVLLALTEVALDRTLLFGAPDGAAPRSAWDGSASAAADHALAPLVTSAALLPMVAWALLAVALPLLVAGRSLTLDLLGAFVWAGGLIAAHQAIGKLLADDGGRPDARGLAVGVVLGVVAAVALAGSGLRRGPGPAPDVS